MKQVLVTIVIIGAWLGVVFAQEPWEGYDEQWVKRNAVDRLKVLNRAVAHFEKAVHYFKAGELKQAERYAQDALKVEPYFSESYLLLAALYQQKGNEKKSAAVRKKEEKKFPRISILTERKYLNHNIERLSKRYTPSTVLNRIVFYLLFLVGYGIIIFLISTSGLLTTWSMRMRGLVRNVRTGEDERPDVVIGEFVGDHKEKPLPWYWLVLIYSVPFAVALGICLLCGARTVKDIVIYTVLPAVFIDVVIWKLFFSDDDSDALPPRKSPMMQ